MIACETVSAHMFVKIGTSSSQLRGWICMRYLDGNTGNLRSVSNIWAHHSKNGPKWCTLATSVGLDSTNIVLTLERDSQEKARRREQSTEEGTPTSNLSARDSLICEVMHAYLTWVIHRETNAHRFGEQEHEGRKEEGLSGWRAQDTTKIAAIILSLIYF